MFDWLTEEIARIKTRKFHVVRWDAGTANDAASVGSDLALRLSYREFVRQFGHARFYRQGSGYLVEVFAVPVETPMRNGEVLQQFGRTDLGLAYFKESLLVPGHESPVFEWRNERGVFEAAENFSVWLRERCDEARGLFRKGKWEEIERGPKPFTEEEMAIVEARRAFRWRIVGVAQNGDLKFEVHNGSTMVLPYLSIGVQGTHGRVKGGVWLPVSSVRPGETRTIEKGCYKKLLAPEDVRVFAEPDPEPEDRDRYWEFKPLP